MSLAANILTGIVIAAVSAWVTVQLSFRRFRAERWWEKKAEAYERVIEALLVAKASMSTQKRHSSEGVLLPERKQVELWESFYNALMEIERAKDLGGYLLSEGCKKRLSAYTEDAREEPENIEAVMEDELRAIDSCLKDIIQMAKNDLGTR